MAWNKCKILHKSENMEAENMDLLEVNYFRMIWKKTTIHVIHMDQNKNACWNTLPTI